MISIILGAVRVSVGYMTEKTECDQLIKFLIDNFLNKLPRTISSQSLSSYNNSQQSLTATISSLYIYPIKSCAGIIQYLSKISNKI